MEPCKKVFFTQNHLRLRFLQIRPFFFGSKMAQLQKRMIQLRASIPKLHGAAGKGAKMKAVKKGAIMGAIKFMAMLLVYDRVVAPAAGAVIAKVKGGK